MFVLQPFLQSQHDFFCSLFFAVFYRSLFVLQPFLQSQHVFCSHFCSRSILSRSHFFCSFAVAACVLQPFLQSQHFVSQPFFLQFFIAACLFCSHFCSRSMCFAAISAVAAFCLAAIFFAVLQSQHVFCSHFCSRSILSRSHFFCSFLSQLVCFAAISAVAACVLQPFLQSQHFVSQPFFLQFFTVAGLFCSHFCSRNMFVLQPFL